MQAYSLHSIILELSATSDALLSKTTGHQVHALFLNLIQQVDPLLAARLHDEPDYRPFTVSPLLGAQERENQLFLHEGQCYRLRITTLDNGQLWQCLNAHILEACAPLIVHLGSATLRVQRVLATPTSDPTGWAGWSSWQELAAKTACHALTLRFFSPTAFSLGDRRFALFPEPLLVWNSLIRSWNLYAPEVLHVDKLALREYITQNITIYDYALHTTTWYFPKYMQRGCIGTCSYQVKGDEHYAAQIAALAEFARYAGIGYKTTMGMGQARVEAMLEGGAMNANARGSDVEALS